ncbi:CaiB/BaiF CoA transferase family protein [Yoonia vestfoldensis]|uniref:CaiB/BaiF CoA transferase family protein n=1 Tax=Yoonia vestfoldensis TaxID=245188 RepID=UPI000381284B|nr:CaiB/BaiF CoA-transferase family protein [Yoonia vestfoldensis]
MTGALDGITVLDLTRILAGPTCTQLLGDLGAEIIKVENPATGGDDTRGWGPPNVCDTAGQPTDLSAYFMAANRNKKSVAIDISTKLGQQQVRALARHADIVVENFKPGGLAKYGLGPDDLLTRQPGLIYCSISGFGQTGPNRDKPGYDLMAQGFGGIMSLTGEPDGAPMKVGVGIADVMCGMYATVGILAALRHRERTGEGQHIDIALVDSQLAWLINEGTNYLESGDLPQRRGNGHPNIVPYHVFEVADGHAIIAVGNDSQFARFCDYLGCTEIVQDARFATNLARTQNRDALLAVIGPRLTTRPLAEVITGLEARKVPVGPVNTIDLALGSDQAQARDMVVAMPRDDVQKGQVRLLGNPLKLSRTPVSYRLPPPHCGQDSEEILARLTLDD